MTLCQITNNEITELTEYRLSALGIKEHDTLRPLFVKNIDIIDENLMVLSEEFSSWIDSKCRIDILAMDTNLNLVVIEIKRYGSEKNMDLQAMRYASMVATMTFDEAVEAHQRYLNKKNIELDAEENIRQSLSLYNLIITSDNFNKKVRMILIAENFTKEVTTTVSWLNEHEFDIKCVEISGHITDKKETILSLQRIYPKPDESEWRVSLLLKKRL